MLMSRRSVHLIRSAPSIIGGLALGAFSAAMLAAIGQRMANNRLKMHGTPELGLRRLMPRISRNMPHQGSREIARRMRQGVGNTPGVPCGRRDRQWAN